ncbi:hypothetical protein EZS27_010535 [termite gut metagenome]|uniref:NIPSNAP domain-containing protein n=1 Tax=termite gut metagenome TaxID=433724 RepID=A0A5J4S6F1_9ZZZZ
MATVPVIQSLASPLATFSDSKEIYEWRIYTLTGNGDSFDVFFENVLIPAYNRFNIKTGAFSLYKKEEEKEKRHILFIYPDITTFHKVKREIWNDTVFRRSAQSFFDASAPAPVYSDFDTYLSEAFDKIPTHRLPDKSRTLFEIRIYRSPNEEANQRKVRMFNVDEINIFDEVGVNSVCYGDILSGPRMPALMYLTWYKDETARTQAWGKFGSHPEWTRIKSLPEYAYAATNNQSILLSPLLYSQL